ncbi:MAG: ferritin [Candidatus Altiarchaeota archaeon]|nr:ferritin [Candidatus Altiarchaeota archaeon]
MLSKKIEAAINGQINWELYSSYLYLSMSADAAAKNLTGMASWLMSQSQEEVTHAMKLYNHVIERGGTISLAPIGAVKASWKNPLEAFKDALEHEKGVTDKINKIVDMAIAEKDHATHNMLHWFVDEQVEEEANATAIVEKLKLIGDNPGPLYMLDKELGGRPLLFTIPKGD